MKKALALFLALCMMFALCACGKEAITADTFAERLEGMGLLVFLNDEEIDGAMVKNAYVGGSEEEDPIVWFYELDSKEHARNGYENYKADLVDKSGSSSEVTTPSSGFYSKKTSEDVQMVAFVDNTVMWGGASLAHAQELEAIFETMGYK